jgi:uncharacterized membrane protein required for colicin V production
MNWSDIVVIVLIAVFAFIGLKKGLTMSFFRVVTFFVCLFASLKLYPVLARILEKTAIFESIKNSIAGNLIAGQNVTASANSSVSGAAGTQAMLDSLKIPGFFRKSIEANVLAEDGLNTLQSIADAVGGELAKIIISLISLAVIYLIIRLVIFAVSLLLKLITKLPVIKQADKLGGFIIGIFQGFLAVYALFALLMLFNANPAFAPVFKGIEDSMFAKSFYENNFILNWMF